MPKITELTAYTTPNVSNDVLPIVDVANDTTKKISVQNLLNPLVNQSVRTDASPTFATVKLTNLTDGYIPRHTSDSVGLENSPIYTDGTNVGIGTTAPGAKLEVSGGDVMISKTTPMSLKFNLSGENEMGIVRDTAGLRIYEVGVTSNWFSIADGSGTAYFAGNVGIGTTAPGAKLEVVGSAIFGQNSGSNNVKIYSEYMLSGFTGNDGELAFKHGEHDRIKLVSDQISAASNDFDFKIKIINATIDGYNDWVTVKGTSGNVGIGTTAPSYQLQLSRDSAAKPSTNTWTVTSDERLKKDIVEADLTRCYEIVKTIPLKYFHWRDDIFTPEQIKDRGTLGWLANDVEPVFPKAVDVIPKFAGSVDIGEETEEYEEQEYTVETVEREEKVIEIRDGKPVQVVKKVTEEIKTPVFDYIEVVDEQGNVVYNEDGTPLTHPIPRMVKKTRVKKTKVEIENCKTVNSDQIMKALYGAVQLLIQKVEQLEAQLGK